MFQLIQQIKKQDFKKVCLCRVLRWNGRLLGGNEVGGHELSRSSCYLGWIRQEWNILAEEDYEMAKQLCEGEIDHGHFAPACRAMSMARRSGQFGTVRALRDANRPEGYGHKDAEESNEMVERMVLLRMMLSRRGATFRIEHPGMSFLWLLQSMQKRMKMKNAAWQRSSARSCKGPSNSCLRTKA